MLRWASQMTLVIKNPPASARDLRHGFDPWVGKIPGEEMETHSSILAWRILWTEEPGGLQYMRSQSVGTWLKWLRMHAMLMYSWYHINVQFSSVAQSCPTLNITVLLMLIKPHCEHFLHMFSILNFWATLGFCWVFNSVLGSYGTPCWDFSCGSEFCEDSSLVKEP